MPVFVRAGASRRVAMPKSITTGVSGVSRMFDGLRSRWTTSASCTAARASASATASATSRSPDIGPESLTASCSVGPSTNAVASHGSAASASAASTRATRGLRTRSAASISRRKRARNAASLVSPVRTNFSAAGPMSGCSAK